MKRTILLICLLSAGMLCQAQSGLRKVTYTSLISAISSAETFLEGLDESQYPASAIAEYRDAILVAKHVVEGETCQTSTEVLSYRTKLNDAKTKLTNAKGKKYDVTGVVSGYQSEGRGFKHPGGLHTQADFDRIRQQLADKNPTVTAAYNVLKQAQYAQPTTSTSPTTTIVRGGSGENYMNAARGAAITYQNALRWKIEDNKACAKHAVDVLMAWCNTTKAIEGTSDACLANGIYGYEFAQAAELMRDYEGWDRADFHKFQQWMLQLWYPNVVRFLRGRNGTWENADKWWRAPGHYWSNWGLCNIMCCISIGVLCDDVFAYNLGMSFFKYDQVGTFVDPRVADPILTDGLTDFLGNLVVTTTEWEGYDGAYGKVGQMNESGRDAGHAAMALGLAVDIAHMGWNQGDDLFAYMDHRLAAGIEYVAAQSQNVQNLPWTNYHYFTSGFYISDSRSNLMTEPALGVHIRPIWGTVLGIYEGVKGVRMPYAEKAYQAMGIDGGGQGSTSGGYDHLGYSVLMNTRDGLVAADKVATEIIPHMTYDGKTVEHNELGGLINKFSTTPAAQRALKRGSVVTLSPTLPEGTSDTGKWQWESGETSREITITADASHVYRVTYTNEHGIQSEQCFAIAVQGDCQEITVTPSITYQGTTVQDSCISVLYGSEVTLSVSERMGYNNVQWDNGQTDWSITLPQVATSRDVQCYVENIGGRKVLCTFHIEVQQIRPDIEVNGTLHQNVSELIVGEGDNITLKPFVPTVLGYGQWLWQDGSTEATMQVPNISTSQSISAQYTLGEDKTNLVYTLYVREKEDRLMPVANYRLRHRETGLYLTNRGDSAIFAPANGELSQIWLLDNPGTARYELMSLADSMYIKKSGSMYSSRLRPHRITFAAGTNYCAIYNSTGQYWYLDDNNHLVLNELTTQNGFPFELIPVSDEELTPVDGVTADNRIVGIYTTGGMALPSMQRGLNLVRYQDGTSRIIMKK